MMKKPYNVGDLTRTPEELEADQKMQDLVNKKMIYVDAKVELQLQVLISGGVEIDQITIEQHPNHINICVDGDVVDTIDRGLDIELGIDGSYEAYDQNTTKQ